MNLKEALDTAPYVCVLKDAPLLVAYGPYSPEVALEFCVKYNEWNESHGFDARWTVVPVLTSANFATEKD